MTREAPDAGQVCNFNKKASSFFPNVSLLFMCSPCVSSSQKISGVLSVLFIYPFISHNNSTDGWSSCTEPSGSEVKKKDFFCVSMLIYSFTDIHKYIRYKLSAFWWPQDLKWTYRWRFSQSVKKLFHPVYLESSPPPLAAAIFWPGGRTGRWRCRWRGSPGPRWTPAGLQSSWDPRGLLSWGGGPRRRTRSPRSCSSPRPPTAPSSAASGRCGRTRTARPPRARRAAPSEGRKPGTGRPEGPRRSLWMKQTRKTETGFLLP